jgi:hypothetical protein
MRICYDTLKIIKNYYPFPCIACNNRKCCPLIVRHSCLIILLSDIIMRLCYVILLYSLPWSYSSHLSKLYSWRFRPKTNITNQLLSGNKSATDKRISIQSTTLNQKTSEIATKRNRSIYCLLIFVVNSMVMAFSSKPMFIERYMKNNVKIKKGELYRLIAPVFLHGSRLHFFCNSLSLGAYGPLVECHYGSKRFLFIYIFSGVFSNLCTFLFELSPYSIGSSGAIFGLVGAMITYFWKKKPSQSTAEKGSRHFL